MINSIDDLQRFSPIVRINRLLKEAGVPYPRIRMRIARGQNYLTVEEAKAIDAALAKFGLKYINL